MTDQRVNSDGIRRVDVCVCTFRRPAVAQLLGSLAAQKLPAAVDIRVIVADNDETPLAKDMVEAAFTAHSLSGVYLHAPARNISTARNACLDAATAPLVAFVDDDEIAQPNWLACLIEELDRSDADVVFGKVNAVYAADAPDWIREADLHSTPAPLRQGRIVGGYTCNVLMRRAVVGGLRFDVAFGRSGGEDTMFFAALAAQGARMAYTSAAIALEPVMAQRTSLRWLAMRAYRSGQTYGLMRMRDGQARLTLGAMALAKVAFCMAAGVLTFWSETRWRRNAVRAHLHAGVLGSVLGRAPLELYGAANG